VCVAKGAASRLKPLDDIEATLITTSKGDLFLMLGRQTGVQFAWSEPVPITEDAYDYAVNAPRPNAPGRMEYFLRFLNSSNEQIADDALSELSRCSYRQLDEASQFILKEAVDELRRRFADPNTSPLRCAVCARVLGFCGTQQDAALFEAQLAQHRSESRYGLKEIACGLILVSGEKGLNKVDQLLIQHPDATPQDAHAGLDAMMIMGDELPGRISKDRLLRSVRQLLDWRDQAWRAIRILARWQDWSIHDRVMQMYDNPDYVPLTRREIIRYVMTASRMPQTKADNLNPRDWAQKDLDQLRKKDPTEVERVEQSFILGTGR
jgi:hypothetical protein